MRRLRADSNSQLRIGKAVCAVDVLKSLVTCLCSKTNLTSHKAPSRSWQTLSFLPSAQILEKVISEKMFLFFSRCKCRSCHEKIAQWLYTRVFQNSRFSLKKKAEPTKHKPGGYIERIQKDFWFRLSLRGPLASWSLTIFSSFHLPPSGSVVPLAIFSSTYCFAEIKVKSWEVERSKKGVECDAEVKFLNFNYCSPPAHLLLTSRSPPAHLTTLSFPSKMVKLWVTGGSLKHGQNKKSFWICFVCILLLSAQSASARERDWLTRLLTSWCIALF